MSISAWVGTIGGLAGLISILVSCTLWFRNRRPRLRLFIPYQYSAIDATNRRPIGNFLLWFTNYSKMPANLFLDTMAVSVRQKGQNHFVQIQRLRPAMEKPVTDFPEYEQRRFGINKISYFNEFKEMPVTIEKPLPGYVCVGLESLGHDSSTLETVLEIRIEIRDQFFKKHSLQVNLEKQQQKYDPVFHQIQKTKKWWQRWFSKKSS